MDLRDRNVLLKMAQTPVWVALHIKPGTVENVLLSLGHSPKARFDYIDTIIAKAPADFFLVASNQDCYLDAEIIDETIIHRVTDMLTEVFRISLYDGHGSFRLGVLNISVGAPRYLLGKRRSGEKSIQRALRHVVEKLNVPVVVSGGNDGPAAGTMNPWAQAPGVIAAVAADAKGERIWSGSSRPASYSTEDPYHLFAAHGENTIGALAKGAEKTEEMLLAEKDVDIASIVGADNVHLYSVRSGTSFAAAWTSRILCFPHQMIQVIHAYLSSTANLQYPIPPFIRGYIDTGIDKDHPVFDLRLADKRRKYGGLILEVDVQRKQRLYEFLTENAVEIRIRYGAKLAIDFLSTIAQPIQGVDAHTQGKGFVSFEGAAMFVSNSRYSTLINLFANPDDPRRESWLAAAHALGDPMLFTPHEATSISTYCSNYDLVLALSLSGR